MKCDQCEALMIQGVFCHETGCPNTNSRYDEESDTWIKQRKCFECGYTVDADDPCCSAQDEDDSEVWNYVSVRYNVDESNNVTDWEVLDHGREHSQYFQGCGTSFTSFDHVSTGIGNDPSEALEDALEMMAQASHVATAEQETEMQSEVM